MGNSTIQEVINRTFFLDAKDEGVKFAEYFDEPGIPLVTIAIVVTAVRLSSFLYSNLPDQYLGSSKIPSMSGRTASSRRLSSPRSSIPHVTSSTLGHS